MIRIIPTDTCYGLAGGVFSREDYDIICELKMRHEKKWFAFLVRDFDELRGYTDLSLAHEQFLRSYPHPWSVVLPINQHLVLPDFLDPEKYSHISFRVAEVCIPAPVRAELQYPSFLTSANLSGQKESQTLAEAQSVFPGVVGYDGGLCDQPPSDIFRIGEDGELQYIRRNYGREIPNTI